MFIDREHRKLSTPSGAKYLPPINGLTNFNIAFVSINIPCLRHFKTVRRLQIICTSLPVDAIGIPASSNLKSAYLVVQAVIADVR